MDTNTFKQIPISEAGFKSESYKVHVCPECGKEYKHYDSYIKYMHGRVQLCSYNCRYNYSKKHPLETKEERAERLSRLAKEAAQRKKEKEKLRYQNDPEYYEKRKAKAREYYRKNRSNEKENKNNEMGK